MDKTTQQEQDAAVIAKSAQRHADLRALTALRCVYVEETALLIRVANAGADVIQAQNRTIQRLTAQADTAASIVKEIRAMDTESMSPLEALTELLRLKRLVNQMKGHDHD